MSVIRLTKTPELEQILKMVKSFYPLLDDAEIIKMIVSRSYQNFYHVPTRQATPEEEELIREGLDAMERGDYITVDPDEPIDLDKIIEEYEKRV